MPRCQHMKRAGTSSRLSCSKAAPPHPRRRRTKSKMRYVSGRHQRWSTVAHRCASPHNPAFVWPVSVWQNAPGGDLRLASAASLSIAVPARTPLIPTAVRYRPNPSCVLPRAVTKFVFRLNRCFGHGSAVNDGRSEVTDVPAGGGGLCRTGSASSDPGQPVTRLQSVETGAPDKYPQLRGARMPQCQRTARACWPELRCLAARAWKLGSWWGCGSHSSCRAGCRRS